MRAAKATAAGATADKENAGTRGKRQANDIDEPDRCRRGIARRKSANPRPARIACRRTRVTPATPPSTVGLGMRGRHCRAARSTPVSDSSAVSKFLGQIRRQVASANSSLAKQQRLAGAKSGADALRVAIEPLDIGVIGRDQGIDIGEPFQPRPGVLGAVNAQIGEQIVRAPKCGR